MKTTTWLQHRRYRVALIASACVLLALAFLAHFSTSTPFSRNPQQPKKLHTLLYDYLEDLEYRRNNYRLHDDARQSPGMDVDALHGYPSPSTRILSTSDHERSYFHLVVPATSSNHNLCKMLLSITALGYPAPVFINWGDEEQEDEYVQHLAKVGGILRHLKTLPRERPNDLVLIVDGYDAWFQLRPDVLLLRYYEVIEHANRRLKERYSEQLDLRSEGFYESIVFGPDKICWPEDPRRTACWAVPQSPLPRYAFGPDTDSGRYRELNRPRWLNSGTIMGPTGDLIALFEATLERIETAKAEIISDQYHMANMFGEQEYARTVLFGDLPDLNRTAWIPDVDGFQGQGHFENITLEEPNLDLDVLRGTEKDYEYHMTVDYESKMFQTNAYYWKSLSWLAYDRIGHEGSLNIPEDVNTTKNFTISPEDRVPIKLADDILSSPPPFAGIGDRSHEFALHGNDPSRDPQPVGMNLPTRSSWQDVRLGTNLITGHVFPIMHFTPPKDWLETWWNKMWFFSYGEAIIKNAPPLGKEPIARTPDGKEWWTWVTDDIDDVMPEDRVGGGFDDRGAWHSWHRLCRDHERTVFLNERKTVVLPPQPPAEDLPP